LEFRGEYFGDKEKMATLYKIWKKQWWKHHWDEIILLGSVFIGIILLLIGLGILKW